MKKINIKVYTRQSGFTLVEILVSLTLGVFLLTGILQIYLSTTTTYRLQDGLSRLQENARFATQYLNKDIRMANFLGCGQKKTEKIGSVLKSKKSFLWNFKKGVQGFENAGWSSSNQAGIYDSEAINNSDIVSVRVMNTAGSAILNTNMSSNSDPNLQVTQLGNSSLKSDDIAVITDCDRTKIFQVTSYNGTIITHTTSGSSPGNRKTKLGKYREGSRIYPVKTVTYYVRPSSSGNGPALWRRENNDAAEEIIEGVENLQITYGLKPSISDSITRSEQYVTADNVTDWADVVSIRIGLLMRTPGEVDTEVDTGTYDVNGTTINPVDDRRLRRVFTTTITVRNRAS